MRPMNNVPVEPERAEHVRTLLSVYTGRPLAEVRCLWRSYIVDRSDGLIDAARI